MKKSVSSIDDILKVMPDVADEVRRTIRARRAMGDEIGYIENDKVFVGEKVVADLAGRRAALSDLIAPNVPKRNKRAA
jgi:hypothetical protein